MPLDAVLFDFDMTLIDTSVALLHNVNMIADAFGRPRCSREKLLEAIGFNTRDFWTFLLGDDRPEYGAFYVKHCVPTEAERMFPANGALECLSALRGVGRAARCSSGTDDLRGRHAHRRAGRKGRRHEMRLRDDEQRARNARTERRLARDPRSDVFRAAAARGKTAVTQNGPPHPELMRRPVSYELKLSLHLHDHFHFARRVAGQRSHADGAARVRALLAEDFSEELRRTFDHLRLFGEIKAAVDETRHLDDALYVVKSTVVVDDRETVDRTHARGLLRLFDRHSVSFAAILKDAVDLRRLAGGE